MTGNCHRLRQRLLVLLSSSRRGLVLDLAKLVDYFLLHRLNIELKAALKSVTLHATLPE